MCCQKALPDSDFSGVLWLLYVAEGILETRH